LTFGMERKSKAGDGDGDDYGDDYGKAWQP
jgi:hypothetical protein